MRRKTHACLQGFFSKRLQTRLFSKTPIIFVALFLFSPIAFATEVKTGGVKTRVEATNPFGGALTGMQVGQDWAIRNQQVQMQYDESQLEQMKLENERTGTLLETWNKQERDGWWFAIKDINGTITCMPGSRTFDQRITNLDKDKTAFTVNKGKDGDYYILNTGEEITFWTKERFECESNKSKYAKFLVEIEELLAKLEQKPANSNNKANAVK